MEAVPASMKSRWCPLPRLSVVWIPTNTKPSPSVLPRTAIGCIGQGAVKMLPEVLKGGRRVMLTADPTEAALMPLDRGAGAQRLDVIFPVLHGTFGEDGTIQGMLDLAGLALRGRRRSRLRDRDGQGRGQTPLPSRRHSCGALGHRSSLGLGEESASGQSGN